MPAWLVIIPNYMVLDIFGREEHYLSITGGPYLLTSSDCPDDSSHNNFVVQEEHSCGFWCSFLDLKQYTRLSSMFHVRMYTTR